MAFVKVRHGQRLQNVGGDFLIVECQTRESSAACTRVSDKLVLSQKGSVKGHDDDDALP
jgi:hypothetical protein